MGGFGGTYYGSKQPSKRTVNYDEPIKRGRGRPKGTTKKHQMEIEDATFSTDYEAPKPKKRRASEPIEMHRIFEPASPPDIIDDTDGDWMMDRYPSN